MKECSQASDESFIINSSILKMSVPMNRKHCVFDILLVMSASNGNIATRRKNINEINKRKMKETLMVG